MAIDLLTWLKQNGLSPRFDATHDPEAIVAESYHDYKPEPHTFDSQLYCNLEVDWKQPEEALVELWFKTWGQGEQYLCRINVSMPPSAHGTLAVLDSAADYATKFAARIHRQLGALLTIVDASSVRQISPYNLVRMPLWVGWCSLYGKQLVERYDLAKIQVPTKNLSIIHDDAAVKLCAAVPFSRYMREGWGESSENYLRTIGGSILH